jgi:hypothetical protein
MKATVGLLIVALISVGCASTIAGPEGTTAEYRWIKGELKSTVEAPLPRVERATLRAFEELNLVGVESAVDGLKGRMEARMAIGTKVRIKLKALDFGTTAVRVRVGTIGDRSISLQLLRHIRRELEEMAQGGV